MSDEKKPDPNATIQLDQVEALDRILFDEKGNPVTRSSATPPPLPPSMSRPHSRSLPSPPSAHLAKPRSMGKTVAFLALFVVLLAVMVVFGLRVGGLIGGSRAGASASSIPAAAPSESTGVTIEFTQ